MTIPPERRPRPLEPGDSLTREEFERRYDAMPYLKKAELIQGVVHMPSPVRAEQHGQPHLALGGWLMQYWAHTPGVRGADNSTLRVDNSNEPQPDLLLYLQPQRGGQARLDDEGYLVGAPELVAEVAASSVSIDLHSKREVYLRNGVREYLVWRVLDGSLDWFVARQGQFEILPTHPEGYLRSEVFPGLWLDVAALLAMNLAEVLRVGQLGIASSEHVAFVAQAGG